MEPKQISSSLVFLDKKKNGSQSKRTTISYFSRLFSCWILRKIHENNQKDYLFVCRLTAMMSYKKKK